MHEQTKELDDIIDRGISENIINFISKNIEELGWNETRQILLSSIKNLPWYQQYKLVLTIFKIESLEGIDVSLNKLLNFESENTTYEAIRNDLSNHAIRLLDKQIEKNGSTLFFNIDNLAKTIFAHLIPKIIELRKEQFQTAYENLLLEDYAVHLIVEEFVLTHYGNQIVGSLDSVPSRDELIATLRDNDEISEMTQELNNDDRFPIPMSDEFRIIAEASLVKGEFDIIERNTDETEKAKKLIELGFPHIKSALNVLTAGIGTFNNDFNIHPTLLHEQAVQILKNDKRKESTEYLIKIVNSLEIYYGDNYVNETPVESDIWGAVIKEIIVRNYGKRIVSKLESVLKELPDLFEQDSSNPFSVAAKYLAKIKSKEAYSLLWSCVTGTEVIFWDIIPVIQSIGPSIEKKLWSDLWKITNDYYPYADGLFQYLEKMKPSSWPDNLGMAGFNYRLESTKWMIEYIARYDRKRALRELCYYLSNANELVYEPITFDDLSELVQTLEINLTEDEIFTVLKKDNNRAVVHGAFKCLAAFQTEKGYALLEGLITDKKHGERALTVLAEFGNES